MAEEFKPFGLEHCPNCKYEGVRDCDHMDLHAGKQTIRHWCEECGWETFQIYEIIYHDPLKKD